MDSTPDFKKALLAFVTGSLTDPTGVDELTMLALYSLRGSTADVDLRNEIEAMIRRVELRDGRYFLTTGAPRFSPIVGDIPAIW